MILETVVTTINRAGELNIAPMGAVIAEPQFDFFELRPFKSSTTFENLLEQQQGVLHVTDDCRLIARAALGLPLEANGADMPTIPAKSIQGQILTDCCRCYEFRVQHSDVKSDRTNFVCRVERTERFRDFIGFNRARHSIIEAAILATRVDFIPREEILDQMRRLKTVVEKTGDLLENETMVEIDGFLETRYSTSSEPSLEKHDA